MSQAITTIRMRYIFEVNSFLVRDGDDCVLVDTGVHRGRSELVQALRAAGCEPEDLRLVVVTHVHSDHVGNCAYLQAAYGCRIALHARDAEAARHGDMFFSPKGSRFSLVKAASSLLGVGRFNRFEPDVLLEEGQSLAEYGVDATVIHLPGHSPGSIGILLGTGELLCGDLFTNRSRPEKNTLVDDVAQLDASVARVAGLGIARVYPGHGDPFETSAL